MNLSIPKNAAAKDPYARIAGPKKEIEPENVRRERMLDQGIKLDCNRFLIRHDPYPYRSKPGICRSFVIWEPDEFAVIRPVLMKSAAETPSAFVKFCRDFPETPDEQVDFFIAAGFLSCDAERIVFGDLMTLSHETKHHIT